jgi:hypothetical protein
VEQQQANDIANEWLGRHAGNDPDTQLHQVRARREAISSALQRFVPAADAWAILGDTEEPYIVARVTARSTGRGSRPATGQR